MRFSIVAILGLAAFVTAQSSSPDTTASPTSQSSEIASSTSTSLSPEETCLAACGYGDICCQAKCVNVPCPNEVQVNATTACAAQCPQGNGTQQETEQYASCQASCVSSYFLSTGTAGAAATGAPSGSNTASFGDATATVSGSNTRSGSGSVTGSTASATQNAAHEIRFGAAGAGLLGLIVAGLAM